MRDQRFELRFSKQESEKLLALASKFGLSKAGLIRKLIREQSMEINVDLNNHKVENAASEQAEVAL